MTVDSHAHYSRYNFNRDFPVWKTDGDGFSVEYMTREGLFDAMRKQGVAGFLEPSVDFESIPSQLALASAYPGFVYPAIGVHPTRCFLTRWKNRKRLEGYLKTSSAVAVGETGLDFHYPRLKQHRFVQKRWFVYQIKLADRLKLPLVLHIRQADRDALKILQKYRARLHGGVVHCYKGDEETARRYIALGFAVGIGGSLWDGQNVGQRLCATVAELPLGDIVLETDAPYVSPEIACPELSKKQWGRVRNSSLILPNIVQKIAEIKGIPSDEVERVTTQSFYRIFGLCRESSEPDGFFD